MEDTFTMDAEDGVALETQAEKWELLGATYNNDGGIKRAFSFLPGIGSNDKNCINMALVSWYSIKLNNVIKWEVSSINAQILDVDKVVMEDFKTKAIHIAKACVNNLSKMAVE